MTAQVETSNPTNEQAGSSSRTDAVTDVALTMPIFVAYHVGVVFLPVRNAADVVTSRLANLAEHDRLSYVGLTLAIGLVVALGMLMTGNRAKMRWESFALVAIEGVLYAMAMRFIAGFVVAQLHVGHLLPNAIGSSWPLAPHPLAAPPGLDVGVFTPLVMSLGAGFYEELTFRVLLFGVGAHLLTMLDDWKPWLVKMGWAVVCAAAFSAWHHVGAMGEEFSLDAFIFRTICGLAFTLIYAFRGFAPAVWTHALYDVWVMVL
ncbi:MAG: CPBP family intramembrane glutamic endopeptidase [Polyangiaceae bacterium]